MPDRKELADSGKDNVVYEIFTVTNLEKICSFEYTALKKNWSMLKICHIYIPFLLMFQEPLCVS